MSDAFADLWNSTGASKPAEAPRNLGAMASGTPMQPAAPRKPQNDVFSMLASAGSSSSFASRSGTPAHSPSLVSNTPVRSMQTSPNGVPINATRSGGDAFSGLLSGSLSAAQSSSTTNLTMAQRAALAEKERMERAQTSAAAPKVASAWAGLDALGGSISASSKTSTSARDPLDDFGFGSFPSPASARAPSKSPQPAPAPDDDWGFGNLTSPPIKAAPSSTQAAPTSDLFGFDDLVSVSSPTRAALSVPRRPTTPGDFDFGDKEDGLLGSQSDEEDILGDLGKPVEQLSAKRSARNTPSPQPPSGQRSRAVSPPPHVLGQIVEMGFSIQQARVALAATDSGFDVQAALEMLLSNGAGSSSPAPEERARGTQREPGHERYYGSDEEAPRPPQRAPPRNNAQTQPQRSNRERPVRDGTPPAADTQRNLQDQADKLIAQASGIGLSMFNRANALFKEGKERAMRAYEERATATASSSRQNTGDAPRRNGRPKWMQDAEEDGDVPDRAQNGDGFRDDDDGAPPQRSRPQPRRPARAPEPPQPVETPASRIKVGNLFSDDPPAVYVSPFRRKAPTRGQPDEVSSPAPAATAPKPTPPRKPSPVALIQRNAVSATQSAIATSAQQKAAGTEKFKLGQYGEAEPFYTAAISALPENHLLLVPLYNNRALTRLKTGDSQGAVQDCTLVVNLIGPSYHPAREAKVTREDQGASVDLADGLIKAWRRRAEAYEGRERWELAKQDWESIAASEFAGRTRQDAFTGISRCRRMLSTNPDSGVAAAASPSRPPVASKPRPKPKPAPRPSKPTPPSDALNRVQEANVAAEAEDQAKHDLKDVVDQRLATWRAGKENNIRALIASLDTVLWPELGWQKVGIHELVSPSQVKIRYTKAIAKLHPDKLSVQNTTVEQRMIANGVFGTLNEAWNAFKP
ncbi:hypothetical protein C8Q80DRAFT_1268465 [Daedaleopsis nitida]|nr:hypothetical protein C8Q80DRAFT_1268465 [Daedaleopsis nitida]